MGCSGCLAGLLFGVVGMAVKLVLKVVGFVLGIPGRIAGIFR